MSTYYTILTTIGAAEWAAAEAGGIPSVPVTHLAVGDGNGAPVTPTGAETTLVHEVHRVTISSLTEDPEHPNWLIVEAVIPTDVGGWTIREIGLVGGSGAGNKLLAIGNFPDTVKPVPGEGVARDLAIRMVIQVNNTAVVEIVVDPSVILVTQQTVINAVAGHQAAADPHPQYIPLPARAAPDGVASLDAGGRVPLAQLAYRARRAFFGGA